MFLIFLLALNFCTLTSPMITYEFNGGRFGDCLSTYCKAKWYAYKHKLKLLYKPFTYSDQLNLHLTEASFDGTITTFFDAIIKVNSEEDITRNKGKNVLFISNFYSRTPGLYEFGLQDKKFAKELRTALMPIIPSPIIKKELGTMTVALHVRKGGGFDQPLASKNCNKKEKEQFADKIWPTKFPPDQYYIDQVKTIAKLAGPETKVIIYLLTDDKDPASLAQHYEKEIDNAQCTFIYRTQDNSHDAHVIEDFWIMAQCDCLIRSSSLFAKAAQLLGNHHIIISPIHGYWENEKLIIDPVNIIIKN